MKKKPVEWTEGRKSMAGKRVYTEEQRLKKNEYNRKYYQKKKDYILTQSKERRDANKEYERLRARKYQRENKEKIELARIKKIYGLSEDDYTRLKELHNNKCYICSKEEKRLHIDHNHVTGKVRKLLCSNCNKALGLFFDSQENVLKAYLYLKEHDENME